MAQGKVMKARGPQSDVGHIHAAGDQHGGDVHRGGGHAHDGAHRQDGAGLGGRDAHHQQDNRVDATKHAQLRGGMLCVPAHELRQQPRIGENRQSRGDASRQCEVHHAPEEAGM
mgnify:CR=1 FL=1